MKITMLGSSGSGKTVYMSAMSELFYNGSVDGYSFSNRDDDYESGTFAFRKLNEINTLYQDGSFPAGTASSIILPLALKYHGENLIDIDWIDYRGGAIKELANGRQDNGNDEIYTILLASDVILVFVDAAVLKVCKNDMTARARVGANEISQILSLVAKKKKHVDVIFLLSKSDSSIINIREDIPALKKRVGAIYSRFLAETGASLSDYPVIPIGAMGYGNVETNYEWRENENGGKTLVFENKLADFENMHTVNIASSFATALLLCLDSETKHKSIQASELAVELNRLRSNFGPMKNLFDILFHHSRTREHMFDLEQIIYENHRAVLKLDPHRANLERIAKSCQ